MEWKEVRLGDILQEKGYIRGPFGSALKRGEMKSEGIPVYEQQHAIYDSRSFRFYIGKQKFEELKRFQVKTDDLIISCSGTVGEISIIKDDDPKGIISQALLTLRVDQGQILPIFLYYFFKTSKGHNSILERSSGSVQVNIAKRNVIEDIRLLLPNLSAQHRITSILSSLDRKIELNNKINAQLEEMAQAIFKSWFVDFEPFKDGKFVESKLGMIPEGLYVKTIRNIPHKIETGRRPKGGVGTITHGVPSIGAEHVKGMGNFDYSKVKYIPQEYADSLKTGKVEGYELLIYKDGGKPGYFIPNYSMFGEGYPYDICYLNEHVFKLNFEAGKWYNVFCYFYFQTDYVMNYLNAQGGKAAIPGINKNDVESLLIFTPDNEKVKEFGELVLPFFTTILKNLKANRELAQLRDTLLPKLMNGEIELPNDDYLQHCLYYKGEEECPYPAGTHAAWYWRDEAMGQDENHRSIGHSFIEEGLQFIPLPAEQVQQLPSDIQDMLAYATACACNMQPMGGDEYLKHYGKSIEELNEIDKK